MRDFFKLINNRESADSIVGVSKVESKHPEYCVTINNNKINPYKGSFSKPIRRQDLDELFFMDGSLYISDIDKLLTTKSFYHSRTMPYVMPKWKSFEVDDIVDFFCIENIMKNIKILTERK